MNAIACNKLFALGASYAALIRNSRRSSDDPDNDKVPSTPSVNG